MNGDFLLDTNVVIALLASDCAILKRKKRAEKFFVPSIVVGELFYGTYHSAHFAEEYRPGRSVRRQCRSQLRYGNRTLLR